MTIDERLDRLTDRHEALTQSVELLGVHLHALSEKHDRENTALNNTLRRAIRMAVTEARNERRRRQTLDEYITKLAAAQLITEERVQRTDANLARLEQTVSQFIDSMRRGGNGHA